MSAQGEGTLGACVAKQGLLGLAAQNLADRFSPAGKGEAIERKRACGEVGDEGGVGWGVGAGAGGSSWLLHLAWLVAFNRMSCRGKASGIRLPACLHKRIWFGRAACVHETARTSRPARLRKRIWFGRLVYTHERVRTSGLACRHR